MAGFVKLTDPPFPHAARETLFGISSASPNRNLRLDPRVNIPRAKYSEHARPEKAGSVKDDLMDPCTFIAVRVES